MNQKIISLIIAILICEGAGGIGSIFTSAKIPTWYAGVIKPSFNPPNWIFGPVWITLFLMMGISVWLIWQKGIQNQEIKIALAVFAFQLILNIVWSLIFFGLQSPGRALIEIIFLWLAILVTIFRFFPLSSLAAWLLVPYLLWVSFAAVLNFSIWRLNS